MASSIPSLCRVFFSCICSQRGFRAKYYSSSHLMYSFAWWMGTNHRFYQRSMVFGEDGGGLNWKQSDTEIGLGVLRESRIIVVQTHPQFDSSSSLQYNVTPKGTILKRSNDFTIKCWEKETFPYGKKRWCSVQRTCIYLIKDVDKRHCAQNRWRWGWDISSLQ